MHYYIFFVLLSNDHNINHLRNQYNIQQQTNAYQWLSKKENKKIIETSFNLKS